MSAELDEIQKSSSATNETDQQQMIRQQQRQNLEQSPIENETPASSTVNLDEMNATDRVDTSETGPSKSSDVGSRSDQHHKEHEKEDSRFIFKNLILSFLKISNLLIHSSLKSKFCENYVVKR